MLRLVIIAACAATVQAACDAIEVAGTDSDISTGSFDGLYDQAGACNGQPYYKCTCCTDYDQFLIDKCATPGECDEGWSETRCMSDSPSGAWHHYLWYSSDDEAWQLRMYVGGGADDDGMFAWDECGGSSTFFDEYRLADPDGDLAAATASTSWELKATRRGTRACDDGHLRGGLVGLGHRVHRRRHQGQEARPGRHRLCEGRGHREVGDHGRRLRRRVLDRPDPALPRGRDDERRAAPAATSSSTRRTRRGRQLLLQVQRREGVQRRRALGVRRQGRARHRRPAPGRHDGPAQVPGLRAEHGRLRLLRRLHAPAAGRHVLPDHIAAAHGDAHERALALADDGGALSGAVDGGAVDVRAHGGPVVDAVAAAVGLAAPTPVPSSLPTSARRRARAVARALAGTTAGPDLAAVPHADAAAVARAHGGAVALADDGRALARAHVHSTPMPSTAQPSPWPTPYPSPAPTRLALAGAHGDAHEHALALADDGGASPCLAVPDAGADAVPVCVWKSTSSGCTPSRSHFSAMTLPCWLPSSGEEFASPRHRAGVASMAWSVDAKIQHGRVVTA